MWVVLQHGPGIDVLESYCSLAQYMIFEALIYIYGYHRARAHFCFILVHFRSRCAYVVSAFPELNAIAMKSNPLEYTLRAAKAQGMGR